MPEVCAMVQRVANGAVNKGAGAGLDAKIADRRFPQSVEAEKYVLGAILLDPNIAESHVPE